MNDSHPISPPRRLQELLTIPERQRTDAQWDEINDLEISLTPINREAVPVQAIRNQKPNNSPQHKKPIKKSHKRSPKLTTSRPS